jgi:type I restriction enzyme S subunit
MSDLAVTLNDYIVPEGWELVPFSDLAINPKNDIVDGPFGSNLKASEYTDSGVPILRLQNIKRNYFLDKNIKFVTQEKYEQLIRHTYKSGDILITKLGDPLGVACIAPIIMGEGVIVADIVRARLPVEQIDTKYITYLINSPLSIKQFKENTKGTTRQRVNLKFVRDLQLPIAPFAQQKRIVAKIEELFSHIDAGIVALNKTRKLLKQYRQSVLKAAVTGELTKQWREEKKDKLEPASELLERILKERDEEYARKVAVWETVLSEWKASGEQGKKPAKPQKYKSLENNFTGLEKLPAGWCWTKLGNLSVDVFDGPFGSNLKSSDYVDDGVRVIRLENIGSLEFKDSKRTYVTEEKYQLLKKHTVSSGDIIFSSFVADGTRVVVLPDNVTKAINKADCFCVRAFGESIDENYLANFLSTHATYKRLKNQVHGATRPRINTSQLKELEVPVCPAEEQLEIVRLTKEKFESIERLENDIDLQLTKANKNKQSILASAYSGTLS